MSENKGSSIINLNLLSKYRSSLMGFAALMIYFFHMHRPLFTEGVLAKGESFLSSIGFFGVDVFLILSGIGLYYSMSKNKPVIEFYKNRFIRVVPTILITAIFCAFFRKWTFLNFVLNVTGINYFTKHVYSFLWFGIFICVVYLVFPLIFKFLKLIKNEMIGVIFLILFWELLYILIVPYIRIDLCIGIERFSCFLVGVLLGILIKNNHKLCSNKYLYCSIILIGLSGYYLEYKQIMLIPNISNYLPAFLMAISSSLVLVLILNIDNKIITYIKKILDFFGDISFEFYCVQDTLKSFALDKLGFLPNIAQNIIIFILFVLIAKLFHLTIQLLAKKIKKSE